MTKSRAKPKKTGKSKRTQVRVSRLAAIADQMAEMYRQNAQRGTGVDAVYWAIRDAIRTGLVQPGTHLTELEVAAVLHSSRTPIREAFSRLETEHLLERSNSRSLVVPVLTLGDLVDIFEVREVLFGLAARCAAQRANSNEIALMSECITRMERARDAGDVAAVSQASADLHRRVEAASKNRRLCKLIRLNSASSSLFEFSAPDRIEQAVAEHCAIFEAIAAHDVVLAERLAQEHSRNAFRDRTQSARLAGNVTEASA